MDQYNTNTSKAQLKPLKLSQVFNQYLSVKKTNRTLMDIFLWWERKRIAFNMIVVGLFYICMHTQNLFNQSSTEELFSKRELILFIVLYNIIYSGFCVLEFFIKKSRKFGPTMFKNALFICTAIITIPTIFNLLEKIAF